MKVEYINSFVKASIGVINNFATVPFAVGKPYVRTSPYSTNDIVIMLGITGNIKGQATFSMSEQVAKETASAMMMGMPVNEIDEMAKSALSELGNMIMGNSATLLYSNGAEVDITPPSLLCGSNIQISSGGMETLCVPLISGDSVIEFDISVKEPS